MKRSLCLLSTRITSTSKLSPTTHLNSNVRQFSTCRPTLSSKIVTIPHPSGMSSKSAHIIKSYPLDDKDAKWVSLRAIEWKDQEGKERKWECADRRTRKGEADAVAICTIIQRQTIEPHILLISQFRPPVGKSVIEMPAGLIDEGEEGQKGSQKAALRELEEETGYNSSHNVEIKETSNIMWSDPGMTGANMVLCLVRIQLKDDEPDPVAKPDEGEFIEKHLVPMKGLWKSLQELQSKGFAVDARLAHFAMGLELGNGGFGLKL